MVKAFSLVEILIVIAIAGILAAIAVPAYQSYLVRAKLSAVTTVLDAQINKAKVYYDAHDVFPNVQQLGFSSADPTFTPNETNPNNYIFPYVAAILASNSSMYGQCDRGYISFYASNVMDGGPSNFNNTGTVIIYYATLIARNGTFIISQLHMPLIF